MSVIRADAKRILRDPFLLMMTFYLPPIGFLLGWGIPKLTLNVKDTVDLVAYYPMINGLMVLTIPFIMGAVLGMQILSEKDENSLVAVAVTPFSFKRYFFSRVVLYSILGMLFTSLTHKIIGIVEDISLLRFGLTLIAFSLNTPIAALILCCFAKNQVQGFAVLKVSGALVTVPAMSFLLPQNLDLMLGVIPTYWPMKAYFLATANEVRFFLCGFDFHCNPSAKRLCFSALQALCQQHDEELMLRIVNAKRHRRCLLEYERFRQVRQLLLEVAKSSLRSRS